MDSHKSNGHEKAQKAQNAFGIIFEFFVPFCDPA